jgi:hypothetical protein
MTIGWDLNLKWREIKISRTTYDVSNRGKDKNHATTSKNIVSGPKSTKTRGRVTMLRPIEIENSRILVLEWVLVLNIRAGCAKPRLSQ